MQAAKQGEGEWDGGGVGGGKARYNSVIFDRIYCYFSDNDYRCLYIQYLLMAKLIVGTSKLMIHFIIESSI